MKCIGRAKSSTPFARSVEKDRREKGAGRSPVRASANVALDREAPDAIHPLLHRGGVNRPREPDESLMSPNRSHVIWRRDLYQLDETPEDMLHKRNSLLLFRAILEVARDD